MKILLVFLVLLSIFTIAIVQAGSVPSSGKYSDNSIHQWACTNCFRKVYNTALNRYYFKGANFNRAGDINNDVINGNINIINVDPDNDDKDGGLNFDSLFAQSLVKALAQQNPTQPSDNSSPIYAFRPTFYNYRRFPTFNYYNVPYKYNFIARPRYGLGYTNFHGYGGYTNPFLFSNLGYSVLNFPYNYNFMARPPFNPGFTGFNFPYKK
jgi:hypothetical protein